MKILFVTSRIPYPPNRGDKLRIYNVIKGFSENNVVKVLSFVKNQTDKKYLEEFKKEGIQIETVYISKLRSLINLFSVFFSYEPFQVLYYRSKKMRDKISQITSTEKYDVVYFHLFITAQYHNAVSNNALKILDFTDAASLYLKRYLEFARFGLSKIYFTLDFKRIFQYEQIANNFDTTFVCSPVDKKYLEEKGIRNIQVFVNGIDTSKFKYEEKQPEKYRIIFTGNLPYFPNQDAVLYFVKEIFPLVLLKNSNAKFYIVGQNPSKEILSLQSNNVIVTGFVEDIKREYLRSAVNIAPVRFGAGTPNKIIEALALGIPTVATRLTVSGFDYEIQKYISIVDTPELFAEKIIEIFNKAIEYKERMKEASEAIVKLLDRRIVVGRIEKYLAEKIH